MIIGLLTDSTSQEDQGMHFMVAEIVEKKVGIYIPVALAFV